MYVKPKAGVQVRDPVNRQAIPEAGREVPDTAYWQRRLADGDVVQVNPAGEKKRAEPKQDVEPRT